MSAEQHGTTQNRYVSFFSPDLPGKDAVTFTCACCGASIRNPAYVGQGGVYCTETCISRGPVRIIWEHQRMVTELRRRKVRFLPRQVITRIKAEFNINAVALGHNG